MVPGVECVTSRVTRGHRRVVQALSMSVVTKASALIKTTNFIVELQSTSSFYAKVLLISVMSLQNLYKCTCTVYPPNTKYLTLCYCLASRLIWLFGHWHKSSTFTSSPRTCAYSTCHSSHSDGARFSHITAPTGSDRAAAVCKLAPSSIPSLPGSKKKA